MTEAENAREQYRAFISDHFRMAIRRVNAMRDAAIRRNAIHRDRIEMYRKPLH